MKKILLSAVLCFICISLLNATLITKVRIVPVFGNIRYKVGNGEFLETERPVTVTGRIWIDTGVDGFAKVTFPQHYGAELKLLPETMISFQERKIFVHMGKILFKIDSSLQNLIIKTPTAIAGIRGNLFEVDVDENRTEFFVFEGKIFILKRENRLVKGAGKSLITDTEPTVISDNEKFSISFRMKKYWSDVKWNKMYIRNLKY